MANKWNGSAKDLTPEKLEKRKSLNKKILKFGCLPIIVLFILVIILTNIVSTNKTPQIGKVINTDSICNVIKKDTIYQITDINYNKVDSSLNIAIKYKKNDFVSAEYFYDTYNLNLVDYIEGVYMYKKGTSLKDANKIHSLNYVSRRLAERIKKFEESGFEYNIKSYLKKNVDDPNGLEILNKWVIGENEDGTFSVKVSFRAKNVFGALMIHTLNCDMDMSGNGKNIEFDK